MRILFQLEAFDLVYQSDHFVPAITPYLKLPKRLANRFGII